jgi:adenosine deaminase
MSVLQAEQDYYDLMMAYLRKVSAQNVVRAEIFFDPQGHLPRGVAWSTFMLGFERALNDARAELGIDGKLILCFLRHLPESDALRTLDAAMNYRDLLIGVGLDSSELGFPPHLFKNVFRQAKDAGLYLSAHAGEEGPAEYVWEALDILGVDRIDHGNNAITDIELVRRIARDKIALTMCPLSNQRLQSVPDLSLHQLRDFMDAGVIATINSDDPTYFGGYLNENYIAITNALKLSEIEIRQLAENSLLACYK